MDIKALVPWQGKIIGKLVLSRIPRDYHFWQSIGLFKHGYMEEPAYAYEVFKTHYDRVDFGRKGKGFVALEVGPGDSLFSALIAYTFGARSCHLVDVGRYARHDLTAYRQMATYLRQFGLPAPDLSGINSMEALLHVCSADYSTKGLESLRAIPRGTVDFIWSQAVLEHIRLADFKDTMRELRRVLRDDGMCSHRVDLRDHLGGALNNLRFARPLWESEFMARSGFYTNRIRHSDMLRLFEEAGFHTEVINLDRWDRLPIRRSSLAREFSSLPDHELLISGFDVILRPH